MLNINLRNFDWPLLLSVFLLSCVGLAVIYSVNLSQEKFDYSLLIKQATVLVSGFVLLFIFAFFDYRTLGSLGWLFYLLALVLLGVVLVLGTVIHGTRGWFNIFGLSFQPVEIVKIFFIFFLARFLHNQAGRRLSWRFVGKALIILLPVLVLILMQPDWGSAIIILLSWLLMIWFSDIDKKYVYVALVLLAVLAVLAWAVILRDYQKERFLNFVNPERDPLNQGYNVRQSIIAIGSGGFLGRGLGLGPQSQLRFLPETEADFIFASLAEELGFVGVAVIIFLYGLFFWRLLKIVHTARDDFSQLLALGLTTLFFYSL
jgi:rod shape determining protein RodA